MKTKVTIVVLILIAVGLCIGLISIKNQADTQHQEDSAKIAEGSNQLSDVSLKLDEQRQTNLNLTNDIATRLSELAKLSNNITEVSSNLGKTEAELAASKAETAKRDARITELEGEKDALDKQAVDLKTSIGGLETQIADTKKKLDASEGDKAFLQKELNRLMAEKAELERQFNDLVVLKTQVKKLKEELSISRRLEWIRQGIFARDDEKGAQKLMQGSNAHVAVAKPASMPSTNLDLNVEVNSDGSVKVIAPLTNAPATSNAPPTK